jgi:hypothetical protein
MAATPKGAGRLTDHSQIDLSIMNPAPLGHIQPTHKMQQSGFSRTTLANQGELFTGMHLQADTTQNLAGLARFAVCKMDIFELEQAVTDIVGHEIGVGSG